MKRFLPILALALIFGTALELHAQQSITAQNVTTNTVTLPASDTVAQVLNFQGGASVYGTTAYYYWFVSRTASNVSLPAGPLVVLGPASLSATQNISITWTPVSGIASYDVLRTSSSVTPSGACGCGVVLGTTLTTITDSGAALQAYTVASTGSLWTVHNKILNGVQALVGSYLGTDYQIEPPTGASPSGLEGQLIISPLCTGNTADCFFVNENGIEVTDGTVTNGSTSLSTAGQASWTQSMIGQEIMAYDTCATDSVGLVPSTNRLPAGATITGVTDSHHITISAAATKTITGTACVAWGTPDDANLDKVDTALAGDVQCPDVSIATGIILIDRPHLFTTAPGCSRNPATGGQSFLSGSEEIHGTGTGTTVLGLSGLFQSNISTYCTHGNEGHACFVLPIQGRWHDFSISGFGETLPGYNPGVPSTGPVLFEPSIFGAFYNMGFYNYGADAASGTFPGLFAGTGDGVFWGWSSDFDGVGSQGRIVNGANAYLGPAFVFQDSCSKQMFSVGTSGSVILSGNNAIMAGFCTGASQGNTGGVIWVSSGSFLANGLLTVVPNGASALINMIEVNGTGSVLKLRGAQVHGDASGGPGGTNASNVAIDCSVGTCTLADSLFQGGSSGNDLQGAGTFVDNCGNSAVQAKYPFSSLSGPCRFSQTGDVPVSSLLCSTTTPVTVSNTTTETTLMQCSVPANYVSAPGETLRVRARGTNQNSSAANANYQYRIYLDSTVIVDSTVQAVTGDKNTFWKGEANLAFTAVGASGSASVDGQLWVELNNNGLNFPTGNTESTQTVNTTAAHTIKVTVQLGTASASVAPVENQLIVQLAGT